MAKISILLGYGAVTLPQFSEALDKEKIETSFEYLLSNSENLNIDLEFIKDSDVIFIYSPSMDEKLQKAIEESNAKVIISGSEPNLHLSKGSNAQLSKAIIYYKIGGPKNIEQLVKIFLNFAGFNLTVEEPENTPWQGIWHPKHGTFENLEDYLKIYGTKKDFVGIFFHRTFWISQSTDHIKSLVEELEKQDLGVIPVFTNRLNIEGYDSLTAEETIQKYFFKEDKPIINALVNSTFFFMLDHSSKDHESKNRFKDVSGVELLKKLNVPVLQVIHSFRESVDEWMKNPQGIDPMSQVYQVIMPEVDGTIEPIFLVGSKVDEDGVKRYEPYTEHAKYVSKRIKKWVNLSKKPNFEKKIAVVLINPPCHGSEASLAVGFGLDVPESLVRLLKKLKEEGYNVGDYIPETGQEMMDLLMSKKAVNEFRWTSSSEIVEKGGAVGFVDHGTYRDWFDELPDKVTSKMLEDWKDPKEVLSKNVSREYIGMVHENKFVVPGVLFGNILVTPQPKSGCAGTFCDGKACKVLHDPLINPPHQWLAAYRWMTRIFNADMLMHFGTHGYLEFRPGKGVGLSPACWPEITIDNVPHSYIYNSANPMEGVMAKRRAYATIINHMYPPMTMPEVLEDIDELLAEYSKAKSLEDTLKMEVTYEEILELALKNNIKISSKVPDDTVEELHEYINMISGTQVENGLHILGNPTDDAEKISKYVITIMTYDNYNFKSIKRVFSEYLGFDYDELRTESSKIYNEGFTAKEIIKENSNLLQKALKEILIEDIDSNEEILKIINEKISESQMLKNCELNDYDDILKAINTGKLIAMKIKACTAEYNGVFDVFDGKYILPGPSGAVTRGKIEILPTGRNFYTIDPTALPTPASWKVGIKTAEKLVSHYLEHHGKYPENIGQIMWSMDAYKADGEQLAQILYLMGVKPLWNKDGSVKDVEVISLEELNRPRIDTLVRISGITRDTLPNYIKMIDDAVTKVISLDEPLEKNYVKKHYLEYLNEFKEQLTEDLLDEAKSRVWANAPGAYGSGVNLAVDASAWSSDEDLSKVWLQWGSYRYTAKSYGKYSPEALISGLKTVDIVTMDHMSDEHDITNCCSKYAYQGGMYTAVSTLKGNSDIDIVIVDTKDISNAEVRTIEKELERVARSKILNPAWVNEMKVHGYRGANEFSKKIQHIYGWSATTKMVNDWVFDEITEQYILDDEMREWFKENNIYACEEIARRLIEASARGLWDADEEKLEKLKEAYSELEGDLEELMDGESEIQGGQIITSSFNEDAKKESLSGLESLWNKSKVVK
ncbi:cobaltochelatase CobN [Methanococcus maripaludis]|uniref:Cobaltochelatase CobN n=1 Tax=Methanococcus maripaludis TaxID=39152 RepID=A0A7J9P246_METMI|nr:cobaltochelatase subunit CobN [Methanococcus maripaludis]MBA2853514.1 cobaltochelatase CobN [Methanococcus maripaludis]